MINIIPLEKNYIDNCVLLEKQCFSLPWTKEQFLESLENSFSIFLMATIKTQFAGYIGLYLIADEAQILNLAVKEQFRKKGIGEALIKKAEKNAKQKGANKLFLEVRVSNKNAINLYEKCGFSKDGIRKNFYENPSEDALLMCKDFNN